MIIGLTGPNAAGKGEVASCLVENGFRYHSLSDVLRDELESTGTAATRDNLIALGNDLRSRLGPGALAVKIRPRLTDRDIVDSIRNPAEVEVLRQAPGFVLVGVDAPLEVRYRRALARGRPGDGGTLEEFRAREARENSTDPARQQLARTFALADHVLHNDGTLEDLRRLATGLLARLTGSG